MVCQWLLNVLCASDGWVITGIVLLCVFQPVKGALWNFLVNNSLYILTHTYCVYPWGRKNMMNTFPSMFISMFVSQLAGTVPRFMACYNWTAWNHRHDCALCRCMLLHVRVILKKNEDPLVAKKQPVCSHEHVIGSSTKQDSQWVLPEEFLNKDFIYIKKSEKSCILSLHWADPPAWGPYCNHTRFIQRK